LERHKGILDVSRQAPYPPSDAIVSLTWDDHILRTGLGPIVNQATQRRDGSDNWPITWADDGHMYVTYGDGYGFEPYLEEKLGLGFARISGDPEAFSAENVRSPSGENRGGGRSGKKGSGLLMVEGVLYLWLFHADERGGSTSRNRPGTGIVATHGSTAALASMKPWSPGDRGAPSISPNSGTSGPANAPSSPPSGCLKTVARST
jgi:hypothetical protein